MERGLPEKLVFHGDLAGSERAWRMAHLEGVLNGLVLLAVAGIADRLALGGGRATLLAWSLIVTAWGNVVASILGASLDVRGLAPGGSVANTIVYTLFALAVIGILVALVLVAAGARGPRRRWDEGLRGQGRRRHGRRQRDRAGAGRPLRGRRHAGRARRCRTTGAR